MKRQRVAGSYAGIPTFFQAPLVDLERIGEGMTVFGGVPIDQGTMITKVGARFGPREIREQSTFSRALFESASERTTVDTNGVGLRLKDSLNIGDVGDFPIDVSDIMKTTEWVIDGVADVARRGGLPVILGGDHYVAYPNCEGFRRGMAERKANVRIGYLHIDNHTDFRNDYGDGFGRYSHATCVRRLSEGTIAFRNMAWVGLNGRALDPDQYRVYKREQLRMYTARTLRERGVKTVIQETMEAIAQDVDAVYVSIDIDVVNNAEARGTPASVFFGISASEFLEMMDVLSTYDIIKAVDMCEVAPPLDPSRATSDLAANALVTILKRRLFDVVKME